MTWFEAALVIGLGGVLAWIALPLLSDVASLLRVASGGRRTTPRGVASAPPRLVFLVPAHNEETQIAACVRALLGMAYPSSARRVVVIADNSDDRTAGIARSLGAECLERHDLVQRGKPYAIRWALTRIGSDWDAIVIIDADTVVLDGFAAALRSHAPLHDRAVQAQFAVRNPSESWLTRLGDVLSKSTYHFRYPFKRRAGLNCPLTGNGMCIGRSVLERYPWETASLTENWELYAQFSAHGVPIEYCRDAVLLSQEAKTLRQGGTQRRRWTAGRFGVLKQWGATLLRSTSIDWHQKLDCVAELATPSPVIHLTAAILIALLASFCPPGWRLAYTLMAIASLLPQAVPATGAFLAYRGKTAVLAAFAHLPVYILWRCGVLLGTIVGPRQAWLRSARHIDLESESIP